MADHRHRDSAERPTPRAPALAMPASPLSAQLNARPAVSAVSQMATRLNARPAEPANRTGLPDGLKAGVEQLSGVQLDDVRVHRNSSQPAQMQASAFAQGSDIHLGPGQEHHLAHEAWHVAQQKQGRVRPTRQLRAALPVNDDPGLEREADTMGARAERLAPDTIQAKGLADILLGRPAPDRSTAPAQFDGLSAKLIDEDEVTIEGEGDFVWYVGGENQSKKMSHIHLYAVSAEKLTGQLTVRNRESDAGGIDIKSKKLAEEDIRAEVIEKFGAEESGKETRDAVTNDLKELVDYVINKWEREIKDQ
ncbi:DUF4157 domain-containing protein [Sphingomonas gei]|nr:DUF4157 domain-containing protein [Sphingomonas gei]